MGDLASRTLSVVAFSLCHFGQVNIPPRSCVLYHRKKELVKTITEVPRRPAILGSQGLMCSASSPSRPLEMGWKVRGRESQVPAVFLQDRSFRESLASTFPPLLMKLIMNTARGHLTPEIHVKIKYFRNTSI